MHAILTPVGSAGDVNPFIVVGRELRRRGHRVTLITTDVFADVASTAGLEFVANGSRADFERATNNPDLWHPRRGFEVIMDQLLPQLKRAYEILARECEPHETIVVGHTLSLFARVFEESHRAPSVTVHLAPSIFRSEFDIPVLPTGTDISGWPRWAKRVFWWAVDRFAIDPRVAPPLNRWRAELGLRPVSAIFRSWIHSPQRLLGLFPEWFAEPQPDWPAQLRLTGFVLSDESCAPAREATPAQAGLERFLENGDAPIVFTPGSANRHATEFFRSAVQATAALRRRALLVTSYRDHLPPTLPDHVHHAGYAPFATLFPRAAAVVHHGGIGTCAQGLAAGVPQLVMPLGFDQPDNARRLERLGVGATLTPSRFTASSVAQRLSRLLSDDVRMACACWRERIDAAAGVKRACDAIEAQFEAYTTARRAQLAGS